MHGGAVGSVAERVAIACARTVVGENTDLFLGELGISYLAAAPHNVSSFNETNMDAHSTMCSACLCSLLFWNTTVSSILALK